MHPEILTIIFTVSAVFSQSVTAERCIVTSTKFNWRLERSLILDSNSSSKAAGRLEIDSPSLNNDSASLCSVSDLSRLKVTVYGQPRAEQLESMAELLRQAAATDKLEFVGPGRLLLQMEPLRTMANLTDLSAACSANSTSADFRLIAKDIASQARRLLEVQLHSCVWRDESSKSILLSSLPVLRSAKFFGGSLSRLQGGQLDSLPNLRYLYLLRCDLSGLEVGAFDDLPALLHLTVNGSKRLKRLSKGLFRRLASLEQLILSANGLNEVSLAFENDLKRLELLDLGHNDLGWLPVDTFKGLSRLRTLQLGGNMLLRLAPAGLSDKPCLALCALGSLTVLQLDNRQYNESNKLGMICSRLALNSKSSVQLLTSVGMRMRSLPICPAGSGAQWCRHEAALQPFGTREDENLQEGRQQLPLQQQHQLHQQKHPNLALILIFGAICAAHLIVTGTLACLCWRLVDKRQRQRRMNRRRQGQLTMTGPGTALAGDAMESDGYDTGDGSGGGLMAANGSESAAAVLVSFCARPNDVQALGDDFVVEHDFHPREKTCYEFNEDA